MTFDTGDSFFFLEVPFSLGFQSTAFFQSYFYLIRCFFSVFIFYPFSSSCILISGCIIRQEIMPNFLKHSLQIFFSSLLTLLKKFPLAYAFRYHPHAEHSCNGHQETSEVQLHIQTQDTVMNHICHYQACLEDYQTGATVHQQLNSKHSL